MVVKFRKGLDPQIQNTIAMMAYGHPFDTSPENWYKAARTVNQNHTANEAFKTAYQTPISITICPTQSSLFQLPSPVVHTNPTPGNPVPVDIDARRKRNPLPLTCYRCHKARHKALDCPLRFDIRELTLEELQMEVMARMDVAQIDNVVLETEEVTLRNKDFVQNNKWKARPRCLAITISKY